MYYPRTYDSMLVMRLFREDSAIDLMLRGFDRDTIKEWIGEDIGYHGSKLRTQARGIDRFDYKVLHVQQRVSKNTVDASLELYSQAASKHDVLFTLGLSGVNIVKLKDLYRALGRAVEFEEVDGISRKTSMLRGMRDKHGVDNVFDLPEYQERAKQTRLERYGGEYTLSSTSSNSERARQTFRENMQDDNFREQVYSKKSATVMDNYGVDHPMRSDDVKSRMRKVWLEKYGVDHPSKLPEFRQRQSRIAKANFALNGDEIAAKFRATSLRRYGVENYSQTEEARAAQSERMRATMDERSAKARVTTMERYGVERRAQRPADRLERSQRVRENSAEYGEKSRATMLERYGVEHYTQHPDHREAQSVRMRDPEHQRRIREAKRQNGTFNTSIAEQELLLMLVDRFGVDDVLEEYWDERYPFACDFYIPSRDMFIEMNGMWTHGGHWFDSHDIEDVERMGQWRASENTFYQAAAYDWGQRDVEKRDTARISQLNYVVFWDSSKLNDAKLWLAMGAPDSSDWQREYQWLPYRDLADDLDCADLTNEEYERKFVLWHVNSGTKRGTVQGEFFARRFSTDEVLPHDLSDDDILKQLSYSGF